MKRKYLILTIIMTVLVLGASIGGTISYFTAYARASGGLTLSFGAGTTITEPEPVAWTKHLTVTNNSDSVPVYVRAKAFTGTDYQSGLTYSGEGWSAGAEDYWYYAEPLAPGASSAELLVHIGNVPEEPKEGDQFNVIVVYESIPVQYDANGNMLSAQDTDWDLVLDTGSAQEGA